MELTKKDTQMAKGVAVLGMVMLHLFCRLGNLPYTPWIWVGEVPLIYYLGLFGDICVPIFCFCSGYAHYLMADAQGCRYRKRLPGKALRFLSNYWIVVVLFSLLGLLFDRSGQIPGSWKDFAGNILVVNMNYNGAWWFVSTYLILLVLSPAFTALAKRMNSLMLIAASFCVYFAAYIFRFNLIVSLPTPVLQWLWDQAVLLGTSQFSYVVGMVCRRCGWDDAQMAGGAFCPQKDDHIWFSISSIFSPLCGAALICCALHCCYRSNRSIFGKPARLGGENPPSAWKAFHQHLAGPYVLLSPAVPGTCIHRRISGVDPAVHACYLLWSFCGDRPYLSACSCVF